MNKSNQGREKTENEINREATKKAVKEFLEKTYLNIKRMPEDPSGDYINGLFNILQEKFEDAISFFSKAIELDPYDPGLYSSRGAANWHLKEYDKSIQDYNKALEFENLDVIKFFKGPFEEISKLILPAVKNYGRSIVVPEEDLEAFLENSCRKIINRFPQIPVGYLYLGIYYLSKNNYLDAIDNFSQYITLASDNHFGFFLRGICHSKTGQKEAANDDFLKAIETKKNGISWQISEGRAEYGKSDDDKIISNLNWIKNQLTGCTLLNNTLDYSTFLGFIGKKHSVYIMLNSLDIFFELHKAQKYDDMITLTHLLDGLRFSEIESSKDLRKLTSEIFYHYPNFTSLSDVFQRDSDPVFRINTKLSLLKYLAYSFIPVDIYWTFQDSVEDKESGLLGLVYQKEVNQQYNFTHTFMHLTEELQRESIEIIKRKEQDKAQALVDERNKIIADLSHSIKNLISTIIDPLENLKQDKVINPSVIQNALRGANLIREIVNAMNLSFKGSIEDFYYDARENTGKGKMDLKSILNESLIYSISNMFDGKYFSNFVQNYFPRKSIFEEAKSQWMQISQKNDAKEFIQFLDNYFFETDLAIIGGSKFVMGNEKGSAMKLLILLQELILNAVKYSAFLKKEKRFVHIHFGHDTREIFIRIKNRFKEKTRTKTSGIGYVIIENFAKLLNTKPVIKKDGDIYSVEIRFENFWREKCDENSLC
ncbi:MAG: GHKL domain-containing protein [Deltaproteobacteria bacterium]|nr:GHKL domain-containing protein [Deltaproteobacteria bacterium]